MAEAEPASVAPGASTFIAVVVDRSGSMESIRADAIGGFNAFLADQKALPGEATLLLAQFDHEYQVVYDAVPIADVPALTLETFVPRGQTALLDAVGRTLNDIGARLSRLQASEKPSRVIVVIITDGMENASREFTQTTVKEMIEARRGRDRWEILFFCTSEQAIQEAHAFGVDKASTAKFSSTPAGTRDAFRRVSRSISASRRTGRPTTLDPDKRKKMN